MSNIINVSPGQVIDLDQVNFSAKIDFATFATAGHFALPASKGRAIWSPGNHFQQFTIHDPQPGDLAALASVPQSLRLIELEVAVDMKPIVRVADADERQAMLRTMFELVARQLEPSRAPYMVNQYRAFHNGRANPFNRRVPPADATLYYGGKDDPVQVKSYLKEQDQGIPLGDGERVVRVEVNLKAAALEAMGLLVPANLLGFRYRSKLSRYFTFASGARRRPTGCLDVAAVVPVSVLNARDRALWDQFGVGAFLPGGEGPVGKVRFVRNMEMKRRIGQSLRRMEARFRSPIRAGTGVPPAANDEDGCGFAYVGIA